MAWIPNENNLPQVNHKDENKSNDSADNLEWCTAHYNTNYGTCVKRRAAKISQRINQYDLSGNLVASWESISEACKHIGVDSSRVVRCCKGRLRKTGGYIWKYAD